MWAFIAMLALLAAAIFGVTRGAKPSGRSQTADDLPTGAGSFNANDHHGGDSAD